MKDLLNYIDSKRTTHLDELMRFLEIPSISSQPDFNSETHRCADWLCTNMRGFGIDAKAIPTAGHPIVYGEWMKAGPEAKTVLFYGHYDVQPVDPVSLWSSEPFKPEVRDGFIFGRGTADDKGQLFTHVKAVQSIIEHYGQLPVNVKFVIEGEEEAGSSHLDDFIKNNAEMLKCDVVMISDTEWFAPGMPSICYALRGISFIEIEVTGPNRDLHSGTFGGGVDNPLNVLAWMITMLKDKYGRITIPGFYDDVLELTDEERDGFAKLPFNEAEYKKDLHVGALSGETGFTTLERVWARPALDVNGVIGGYTGEGAKTVIPSRASAKISMRLVPNQKAQDISEKICSYLKKLAPPTVTVDVRTLHGGNPVRVSPDSDAVKAAVRALRQAFDREPVFMREGGSIPIVEVFGNELQAPVVLMGLGLPSDNIHSPNENFSVDNYLGGIKASAIFLHEIAK